MVVEMKRLNRKSPEYKKYESWFKKKWEHPNSEADVKQVYMATMQGIANSFRGKCFNKYKGKRDYKMVYHGTQRACNVGEKGDTLWLCKNKECFLCQILWHSFKVEKSSGGGMFGRGIYSTPVSSKANLYARNHKVKSRYHAILLCQVVSDNPQAMTGPNSALTAPSPGYNCVKGLTVAKGGALNYPEIVVYQNEAIIPIGVILYTRTGWSP
jgi:hypothetical protein